MRNRFRRGLDGILVLASALVSPLNVRGDTFFKGAPGPKGSPGQVDQRISYSEMELDGKNDKTLKESTLLKWWPSYARGSIDTGPFVIVGVPYLWRDDGKASSSGLGDIWAGGGIRETYPFGKNNSFNYFAGAGVTFPTGDEMAKPSLGNGRVDVNPILWTTTLFDGGKYEASTSFGYTSTGKSNGKENPDVIDAGLAIGTQITPKIKVGVRVAGVVQLLEESGKEKKYQIQTGPIARYKFGPDFHIEAFLGPVFGREMSSGFSGTVMGRFNLPGGEKSRNYNYHKMLKLKLERGR